MPDSNAWARGVGGHAHNAISQELVRAGLDQQVDAKSLANALMADSPFAKKKLNTLLDLGNPGELSAPYEVPDLGGEVFGQPKALVYSKQFEGYPGRGWDYQEQAPADRQLSAGGKMADQWALRRNFLKTLIDPSESASSLAAYTGNYDKAVQAAKEGAAQTYMAGVGRDKGESGWIGAMENPSEYVAGKLFGPMNTWSEGFQNEWRNPTPNGQGYLRRVFSTGIPQAEQRLEAARFANRVDPMLPPDAEKTTDWLERDNQLRDMRSTVEGARPLPYSYHYRDKTGQYPSYAGDVLAEMSSASADPLTAASLGAGAFMKPAQIASKMGMIRHALTAGARQIGQEGLEEGAVYLPAQAALNPPMTNPLASGNENRPDLPQFEPTPYAVDGNFKEFFQGLKDENTHAREKGVPQLINSYPKPKQQMYY